jgi:periplasmic divalent cation tolerance protein
MLLIAWTTVSTQAEAAALARTTVAADVAVCVQIDGPITSVYRWENKITESAEFRLTFKCLPGKLAALEATVLSNHPYSTPEWVMIEATHVSEKYLSWTRPDPQPPSL